MPPRFALALTLLVSLAAAQAETPISRIAAAEKQLELGQTENAIIKLWQIKYDLPPFADDVLTQAARLSIDKLLAKADPSAKERQLGQAAVAKQIRGLARKYQRRKWLETAQTLLLLGARYDRSVIEKTYKYVAKKIAAAAKPKEEEKPTKAEDEIPKNRFKGWKTWVEFGNWEFRNGQVRSPDPSKETAVNLSANVEHLDNRINLDFRIGSKEGSIGLIFGAVGDSEYLVLGIQQMPKYNQAHVTLYRFIGAGAGQPAVFDVLVHEHLMRTKLSEDQWRRLVVDVRGSRIEASLDGTFALKHVLKKPQYGKVGLYFGAGARNAFAPQFRDLRIEPLPTLESKAEAKAQSDVRAQSEISARFAEVDHLVAEGDREGGYHALRDMRSLINRIESPTMRGVLDKELDQRIAKLDTEHKSREKLRVAAARSLLQTSKLYEAKGKLYCACEMALDARRFHRVTGDPDFQRLTEVVSVQPEPAVAVDNATLIAELTKIESEWGKGSWKRDEDGLVSPKVDAMDKQGASTMLVARRRLGTKATICIQVKPSNEAAGCALAFGYRSATDFYILSWWPDSRGSIQVLHYHKGKWDRVASRSTRFAKKARSTWTTLEVSYDGTHLKARVGLAKPIEADVEAPILGRVGCFVEANRGTINRVTYRNLKLSR